MYTTTVVSVVLACMFIKGGSEPGTDVANLQGPNVVEVTARGMSFDLSQTTIPSGWTTFVLKNESGVTHFAAVERLPDGIGVADQQADVAPVFQEGLNLLNAGDVDAALAKFGELPEWFSQVVFTGGPGLVAPGHTGDATVYLEPGTYLLECYVKTNGIFHSYNPSGDAYGMVVAITVTDEKSGAKEPDPSLNLAISSTGGIEVSGDVRPGEHTIAVHFKDQTVHEHFLGHDVHLVRLEAGADTQELASWMDWTQPTGLETPAPPGAEFLGGTSEMPAGKTSYFTATLKPGRYAWIAEVPDPAGKGMLKTFTVPTKTAGGK